MSDTVKTKPTGSLASAKGYRSKRRIQPHLERTLDNMIDGCQVISHDFRYLYVNKTVADQGRYTKNQLLGRTMMEMYPGIEKTEMFRHLKRCMKNRRLYSMENHFEFPDGGKKWFELKMEPVPEGVLIFSADISERKRYEEIIKRRNRRLEQLNRAQKTTQEALLHAMEDLQQAQNEINLERVKDQAILENIGEGLIAVDSDGKIMRVNKTAETLLGWKAEDLQNHLVTGLTMLDAEGQIIPPSARPIYFVLRNGKIMGPSFAEYYFVRKDGRKLPLGLTVSPIKLHGRIIGAIEIFRDVSKEQEIDRAKTEFVSIASHQLRTPLGISKWYLEAVKEEGYLGQIPRAGQDYLSQVYKSNERVLSVVRDLLSVSRIDQGRIKDNPKMTDLSRLVRTTIQEMRPLAIKKKVKLQLTVRRSDVTHVYIDPLRFHEVLQNLIANAIEYTPSDGRVRVTLDNHHDQFRISVKDTGIGISPEDQKNLFTKFFRSEKGASSNTDGSGLGLYVVKSYVEDWGGKVSVISREGRGSRFIITLPLKEVAKP